MSVFNRSFRSAGVSWIARFLGGPNAEAGPSMPMQALALDIDTPVSADHPLPSHDSAVLAALGAGVPVTGPLTDAQLAARGLATQTTLAAVLAKIIATPATEAKQDAIVTSLGSIDGHVDGLEASATAILAAALAATPAGENHLGAVGGHTVVVAQAVAGSTTPYTSGDCVGGLLTFAGFGRLTGGTGLVQMASVMSKSAQTVTLDLVLFHTNPAASTFADNAALSVNAADWDKVLGVVHLTDWTSLGTPSFAEATALAMAYKVAAGQTDIYGQLVTRGAFTLASTADLKVALKGLLD
jgi:hypothetical protein